MSAGESPFTYESSVPFDEQRMRAVAVYCSDGRFGEQFDDLLQNALELPRYDRLAVPGGAACLASHFAMYREEEGVVEQLRFLVASAFIAVLAFEGVRYSKPLFDLQNYASSDLFSDNFVLQSDVGWALNRYFGSPMQLAFFVSQALFCAPRTSVEAVKAFRGWLPSNADTIAAAARILTRLKQERQWIPATEYADDGAALRLLQKLRLMWIERREAKLFIRYPAGVQ